MMASGVVRGRPVVRPGTVMSAFGPSGMPAPRSALVNGLKIEAYRGARAAAAIRLVMGCRAPWNGWIGVHHGDPAGGVDVTRRPSVRLAGPRGHVRSADGVRLLYG